MMNVRLQPGRPASRAWAALGWAWAGTLVAGSAAAVTLALLGPLPAPPMPPVDPALVSETAAPEMPAAVAPPELTGRMVLPPAAMQARPSVAMGEPRPPVVPQIVRPPMLMHRSPVLRAALTASAPVRRAHGAVIRRAVARVSMAPRPLRMAVTRPARHRRSWDEVVTEDRVEVVPQPLALPPLRPPPGWGEYAQAGPPAAMMPPPWPR